MNTRTPASNRWAPLYHWRQLNDWSAIELAAHLGVNRITVYRFENYKRKPSEAVLARIAALPNFPLDVAALTADYDANYRREERSQEPQEA